MEDSIILYATPDHLNSMSILAKFIIKHHSSISVTIISTAPESSVASIAAVPSILYRRLAIPDLPPTPPADPVELHFEISRLSNPNLREALKQISQKSKIRAFIIDFLGNAAYEVSTSLNIPTYFYFSCGTFVLCVFLHIPTLNESVQGNLVDWNDYIDVPGCPLMYSSDLPQGLYYRDGKTYKLILDTATNMRKSAGILVNAFDALELRANEALKNGLCLPDAPTPPVYLIGPLIAETSNKNGEEHECIRWLHSQPSKSVIFLCFGRWGFFSAEQLREMAIGLENSGHRFLWSVRNPPGKGKAAVAEDPDLDELLPDGFLEMTKDRGFVIKSWAPQKEVLSHDSVAGFVTHCGRSSILEAVSFGVPMICWPLYAEQKLNRTFMSEEVRIALPLEGEAGGFVTAAELEKRVRELMESKRGKDVRRRVGEMKASAEAAVKENGSAVVALERFIESVTRD